MCVHLLLRSINTWIWTKLCELFWFFLQCSMHENFVENNSFVPPPFLVSFGMYYTFESNLFGGLSSLTQQWIIHTSVEHIMWPHPNPLVYLTTWTLYVTALYFRNLSKIRPPPKIHPPPTFAKSYCKGSFITRKYAHPTWWNP